MVSCIQPPEFSNIPEIEYVGINKKQVVQGSSANQDTLIVEFSYTDGDGNMVMLTVICITFVIICRVLFPVRQQNGAYVKLLLKSSCTNGNKYNQIEDSCRP